MLNTKLLSLIVSFLNCLVFGFSLPLSGAYRRIKKKDEEDCTFRQVPCFGLVVALFLSAKVEGSNVGNDVKIGNRCKIQNNVSVYDAVTLEDEVFCGPSMVFTNVYNPRAAIERKDEFRRTLVKRGSTIGANATIVCGVTLGEFSFIAAGAVVVKDVEPYALMAGVPAKRIGWMNEKGERIKTSPI